MLTIAYVPTGKNNSMADTFFRATKNYNNASIGLADPDMHNETPSVGDVEYESTEAGLSARALRCLAYCKESLPENYKKMKSVLGDLCEKHNF